MTIATLPSPHRPNPVRQGHRLRLGLLTAGLAAAIALPAAADISVARAEIRNRDGDVVGNALLRATPAGVLLHAKMAGLPAGEHGFHIHETGKCEPPFDSAGGHLAATGSAHGFLRAGGAHIGDMPNIHVPESGALELQVLTLVTDMDSQLFDADGAALVIHQGADDYNSQPSGDAGPRLACGVIENLAE
jgi:superoxide dismutase, Cu-Zn family